MRTVYTCFPGGKHKVLTMSYDDGREEDRRLVSIFNEHGIRGTFHLNGGRGDDPRRIPSEQWKELYRGHEISCHTYTHPTIARCPIELVAQEILQDRLALEAVTGAPVRGLSYPNGSYSDEIIRLLPMLGIRYARTVENATGFGMPEDFLRWDSTCHHKGRLMELGRDFLALKKRQYLYMMYVWGHSYEFTNDDNWQLIEDFCRMMGGQNDIWYATNIEIVDYMDAASRVQYTADMTAAYNPSAQSVWVCAGGMDNITELKGGALTPIA